MYSLIEMLAKTETPLARFTDIAPSAIMREIAWVAQARGYSQQQLAEAFAREAGVSVNAGNITRHFSSKRPQQKTINVYRDLLGISGEYQTLVDGKGLSKPSAERWLAHLRAEIPRHGDASLVERVIGSLSALALPQRTQLLEQYALNSYRSRLGSNLWPRERAAPIATLANALDLKFEYPERQPHQEVLAQTARALLPIFKCKPQHIRTVIDVLRTALRAEGVYIAIMDDELRAALRIKDPYRTKISKTILGE